MGQFYTRPGEVNRERAPIDLCRERGQMTSVWDLSEGDLLLLDTVIRPLADEIRARANREIAQRIADEVFDTCRCRCREGRHCGGCGHLGCGYTSDGTTLVLPRVSRADD